MIWGSFWYTTTLLACYFLLLGQGNSPPFRQHFRARQTSTASQSAQNSRYCWPMKGYQYRPNSTGHVSYFGQSTTRLITGKHHCNQSQGEKCLNASDLVVVVDLSIHDVECKFFISLFGLNFPGRLTVVWILSSTRVTYYVDTRALKLSMFGRHRFITIGGGTRSIYFDPIANPAVEVLSDGPVDAPGALWAATRFGLPTVDFKITGSSNRLEIAVGDPSQGSTSGCLQCAASWLTVTSYLERQLIESELDACMFQSVPSSSPQSPSLTSPMHLFAFVEILASPLVSLQLTRRVVASPPATDPTPVLTVASGRLQTHLLLDARGLQAPVILVTNLNPANISWIPGSHTHLVQLQVIPQADNVSFNATRLFDIVASRYGIFHRDNPSSSSGNEGVAARNVNQGNVEAVGDNSTANGDLEGGWGGSRAANGYLADFVHIRSPANVHLDMYFAELPARLLDLATVTTVTCLPGHYFAVSIPARLLTWLGLDRAEMKLALRSKYCPLRSNGTSLELQLSAGTNNGDPCLLQPGNKFAVKLLVVNGTGSIVFQLPLVCPFAAKLVARHTPPLQPRRPRVELRLTALHSISDAGGMAASPGPIEPEVPLLAEVVGYNQNFFLESCLLTDSPMESSQQSRLILFNAGCLGKLRSFADGVTRPPSTPLWATTTPAATFYARLILDNYWKKRFSFLVPEHLVGWQAVFLRCYYRPCSTSTGMSVPRIQAQNITSPVIACIKQVDFCAVRYSPLYSTKFILTSGPLLLTNNSLSSRSTVRSNRQQHLDVTTTGVAAGLPLLALVPVVILSCLTGSGLTGLLCLVHLRLSLLRHHRHRHRHGLRQGTDSTAAVLVKLHCRQQTAACTCCCCNCRLCCLEQQPQQPSGSTGPPDNKFAQSAHVLCNGGCPASAVA